MLIKREAMISIYHTQKKEEFSVAGPKEVLKILNELGILENDVLVVREGALVTKDTVVQDGERIEILPVISGG